MVLPGWVPYLIIEGLSFHYLASQHKLGDHKSSDEMQCRKRQFNLEKVLLISMIGAEVQGDPEEKAWTFLGHKAKNKQKKKHPEFRKSQS